MELAGVLIQYINGNVCVSTRPKRLAVADISGVSAYEVNRK